MNNENQSAPERMREVALHDLETNKELVDFGVTYLAEQSGQYSGAVSSALEEFKYNPAMKSEKGSELMLDSLRNSRQNGRKYSGTISEWRIIQDCAAILQESISQLKVKDIFNLMGSQVEVNRIKNPETYLFELMNSQKDTDKELYVKLFSGYQNYLIETKVTEAMAERAKKTKGGLEKLVTEEERQAA